jgi:hypothetical protein
MKFLALIGFMLVVVSAPTSLMGQTAAKQSAWVYRYIQTTSDALATTSSWKPSVTRKVPVLIISDPFEVPAGSDPSLRREMDAQFAQYLLKNYRKDLAKLSGHGRMSLSSGLYFPDKPASIRDYESFAAKSSKFLSGDSWEVIRVKNFKFQTKPSYTGTLPAGLREELQKLLGTVVL